MAIFPVGHTSAYALAREYLATEGRGGIPCQKVGNQLRFPTTKIERLLKRPVIFPVTEALDPASSISESPVGAEPHEDGVAQQLVLRFAQD